VSIRHGGEEVDPRQASGSKKSRAFGGTGYKLGQTPTESQGFSLISFKLVTYLIFLIWLTVIPSTSNDNKDNSPMQITIKMWKSGFSIDDGPLREYEGNREFLDYIKNGCVAVFYFSYMYECNNFILAGRYPQSW